jgi:predicted nucleotidyltransferase
MVPLADIEQLAGKIAREFHPEKIILFGSHARGTAGPDSDVDLLVVVPFDGNPFWKSVEILNRVNAPFSLDLLARCPDDTARRYTLGDPLIREAIDDGRVLYERSR